MREIARGRQFRVAVLSGMLGYAVMVLVMTATPLAMKHDHHSFSDTAFVIQWHVLGMFAPSFITGRLIRRFGVFDVMLAGCAFLALSVGINLSGSGVSVFWLGLTALGVGWNFVFIGATSLLTTSYRPSEKSKAQAANDFVVFTMVAVASLAAGALQDRFGWQAVNLSVIPMIAVVAVALFLQRRAE